MPGSWAHQCKHIQAHMWPAVCAQVCEPGMGVVVTLLILVVLLGPLIFWSGPMYGSLVMKSHTGTHRLPKSAVKTACVAAMMALFQEEPQKGSGVTGLVVAFHSKVAPGCWHGTGAGRRN